MKIAAVVNAHSDADTVLDSVDAIRTYVTEDVLVLIDGAAWDNLSHLPVAKIKGFPHGKPKSPYRNVALALKTIIESFPDADWFCYSEYDVLFGSDRFKHNLKMAEEMNVWMLGNDGHVDAMALPLISALIEQPIKTSYYLLGCCQFFHKNFIKKLLELDFFNKFLNLTNGFADGFFPFYSGYDLSEHLYPTLCRHLGGNIGVFAHFDENAQWHGFYEYYPVRWRPELDAESENFPAASIMHPLKSNDHPIRVQHREKRKLWTDSQMKERPLELSSTSHLDMTIAADE